MQGLDPNGPAAAKLKVELQAYYANNPSATPVNWAAILAAIIQALPAIIAIISAFQTPPPPTP